MIIEILYFAMFSASLFMDVSVWLFIALISTDVIIEVLALKNEGLRKSKIYWRVIIILGITFTFIEIIPSEVDFLILLGSLLWYFGMVGMPAKYKDYYNK